MSNVVDLTELQAHVVIQTPNAVHVVPVITLRRFASGHLSLESIYDGENILRTITQCWLESLRKSH